MHSSRSDTEIFRLIKQKVFLFLRALRKDFLSVVAQVVSPKRYAMSVTQHACDLSWKWSLCQSHPGEVAPSCEQSLIQQGLCLCREGGLEGSYRQLLPRTWPPGEVEGGQEGSYQDLRESAVLVTLRTSAPLPAEPGQAAPGSQPAPLRYFAMAALEDEHLFCSPGRYFTSILVFLSVIVINCIHHQSECTSDTGLRTNCILLVCAEW